MVTRWLFALVVVSTLAAGCATSAADFGEPVGGVEPGGECSVDETLALLQSGLPTYDYEPAGSYEELDIRSLVAVTGRLVSAVRTEVNGGSFTDLTVADVVEIGSGAERPDVDVIAWDSLWANSDIDDPLADAVELGDVHFLAFLQPWSGRRGGWNSGIEGLYIACGRAGELQAVIADGRGADDPMNPSIDELAALVVAQRAASAAEEAAPPPEPELQGDELRQAVEEMLAADPSYGEAVRDAMVQFARGEDLAIEEIPLDSQVALGLGSTIDRTESKDVLRAQSAWSIEAPEGYEGFAGPFSALDVLADRETDVSVGEHPHCASDPLPRPEGFEHHAQISIQPAEGTIDSCIQWFAVDLFVDPETLAISAATLALFGP